MTKPSSKDIPFGNSSPPAQPLVIVLDNIRSGHNVGAAFRIADAFSIDKIYLCGITPTPPHREIRKTALGAENTVSWQYEQNTTDALHTLLQKGYHLVAIEQTERSEPLNFFCQNHPPTPSALIFGNEVWGINQNVLQKTTTCLEIPQHGHKKSLNVATCIAIATWEWTKQK